MKRKFYVKALAVGLCTLTVIITIASVIGTVFMAAEEFYTKDLMSIRIDELRNMAYGYCFDAVNAVRYDDDYRLERYDTKNFYYEIRDNDTGELLTSNYRGEDCFITVEDDYIFEEYSDPYPYYADPEADIYEYEHIVTIEKVNYHVKGYIPLKYTKTDSISVMDHAIKTIYEWRYIIPIAGLASLVLSIVLFVFLMHSAGWHEDGDTVRESVFDRIPFDIFTAIFALIFTLLAVLVFEPAYESYEIVLAVSAALLCGVPLFIFYCMSLAVRIKTGTLFKNTFVVKLIRFLGRALRFVWRGIVGIFTDLPTYGKTVLILAVMFVWEFIICILFADGEGDFGGFLLGCGWILLSALLFFASNGAKRIRQGGERLASGEFDEKIHTGYMLPSLKRHAENLNSIGDGMSIAVEERMKSERFKTELITNVSHDLKTPLTSIVNYVDLLKGELSTDSPDYEKTEEYVGILERQSARLRKLTEDLVDASKASTGNLDVKKEPLELSEFLSQVEGEYSEKLKAAVLDLILRRPDATVVAKADGRHLWRILDNLMSNVVKYALTGTRVYLDLACDGKKARIIVRNTSKYAINVSADELSERFVRGDVSRHTEGSGLGLSIAKSLIELQGGDMAICVDGDLFKVTLELPCGNCPNM